LLKSLHQKVISHEPDQPAEENHITNFDLNLSWKPAQKAKVQDCVLYTFIGESGIVCLFYSLISGDYSAESWFLY